MILVLALSIFSVSATAEEMRRIDSDGYLYFMDYTGDYYDIPDGTITTQPYFSDLLIPVALK